MTQVARSFATERIRLRLPAARDLAPYRAHYGNERSRFQGGPYSDAQCFEKLAAMIGHWELRGFGRYVIEVEEQAIGHVGPLQIEDDSTPELTWSLWSEEVEGKGYASEAAIAVSRYLLRDCGWPSLTVLIQPDNAKSLRVAERIGAKATDHSPPDWYAGARVFHLDGAAIA